MYGVFCGAAGSSGPTTGMSRVLVSCMLWAALGWLLLYMSSSICGVGLLPVTSRQGCLFAGHLPLVLLAQRTHMDCTPDSEVSPLFFSYYSILWVLRWPIVLHFCLPNLYVAIIYFVVKPDTDVFLYKCWDYLWMWYIPYDYVVPPLAWYMNIYILVYDYIFFHYRCCDYLCVLMPSFCHFVNILVFQGVPVGCWSTCWLGFGSLARWPLRHDSVCGSSDLFLLQSVTGGC